MDKSGGPIMYDTAGLFALGSGMTDCVIVTVLLTVFTFVVTVTLDEHLDVEL
jgi:hypothetical protein